MANSRTVKTEAVNDHEALVVGTYVAYGPGGEEIYSKPGYIVGDDIVPFGVSVCMKAMKIVDPKTGEVIKTWNPWGVI